MERKDFLKTAGLLSLTSIVPLRNEAEGNGSEKTEGICVLIPQETAGPYILDLSSNSAMFRQDITEGNSGTPLNLTLTIVNINDACAPIANARVDIWHCNKEGYYSAFNNQPGYLGTQNHAGETFFRGIQLTDSNGQVRFTTIYPGWYPGRVTHIHFQVFLSSVLKATSQLAFPENFNTAVNGSSLYSAHGQNPTKNTNDGVFFDSTNTQYETLTILANSSDYDGTLTVGISVPTTGVINLEPETGGQFKLGINFPNPFSNETTIPFALTNTSQVTIELFDLNGKKVGEIINTKMNAGKQAVALMKNSATLNLAAGSYVYQLTVENENGIFRQCKLLTVK